ncbi:MAG: response regulator transcription factor [Bacillota bacterium]
MFKVLVAEDNANIRFLIAKNLQNNGYEVVECHDGKHALQQFESSHFDIIITDIMMPNMDGNEFAKNVRKTSKDIPIIMLTALDSIEDKEVSFENGADDYMVKPIVMKELLLRVGALLRRYDREQTKTIALANTIFDYTCNSITISGNYIELTKKQCHLLFKLLSHPNKLFSREQLMDEIWGFHSSATDRTVDTHISWLRDKVKSPDFDIITVRGVGYKAVLK